jgi:ferredoxin
MKRRSFLSNLGLTAALATVAVVPTVLQANPPKKRKAIQSRFKAHIIADQCVACGACVDECPVNAITESPDGYYVVDMEKCIDCGACIDGCPVDAIAEGNK